MCRAWQRGALRICSAYLALSNQSTCYCRFATGCVSALGRASPITHQSRHFVGSKFLFSIGKCKTLSSPFAERPSFATSRHFISRLEIRMYLSFQNPTSRPCPPNPKNKLHPLRSAIYTYTRMHTHTYAHEHTCASMTLPNTPKHCYWDSQSMHKYAYTYIYKCIYMHMYTDTYTHAYTYICTCPYTYIHTHIYTHTFNM